MRRLITPVELHVEDRQRRRFLRQWGGVAASSVVSSFSSSFALFSASPTHAANEVANAAAGVRRLISVGGGLTEIVYALQAEAELVGVDTTSLYPSAAQKLPSVGYARSLSAEGILALAPTHIIASEEAGPPSVLRQLSAAGIALEVLASNYRYEGLEVRIKRVGELTRRSAQAAALQQSLQQEWNKVRAKVDSHRTQPARVLFILAHSPHQIMVAGTATGAHAVIGYAGGVNAIHDFSGYKPLTPEAIIPANPDIILLTDQGLQASGGVDNILKLPGLAYTSAGRHRRIISLGVMFLLGFGPRLPMAVSALSDAMDEAMSS